MWRGKNPHSLEHRNADSSSASGSLDFWHQPPLGTLAPHTVQRDVFVLLRALDALLQLGIDLLLGPGDLRGGTFVKSMVLNFSCCVIENALLQLGNDLLLGQGDLRRRACMKSMKVLFA